MERVRAVGPGRAQARAVVAREVGRTPLISAASIAARRLLVFSGVSSTATIFCFQGHLKPQCIKWHGKGKGKGKKSASAAADKDD